MRTVFADSYYFLALWNKDDSGHSRAVAFTLTYKEAMLTTDFVLTEVADALACPPHRERFLRLLPLLRRQRKLTVAPAPRALWDEGLDLYSSRPDKEWSLTDCVSFVAMTKAAITEALTADRHFEQAGFTALLK